MALNVQVLFQDASRMFNSSGYSPRFEADFVACINYLLDKMSFQADLATAIPHITASDETIDELDFNDYHILLAGLEWKMGDFGATNSRDSLALQRAAKAEWLDALGDFTEKKYREDLATTDDNGNYSNDIIGLGYKGDNTGG